MAVQVDSLEVVADVHVMHMASATLIVGRFVRYRKTYNQRRTQLSW